MRRRHALLLSLALAACAVTGASAALKTVHLGAAAARPPRVADAVIAARSAKLDRFAASLEHARRSRPPALPPLPHFAPVPMPSPPAPGQLASTLPAAAPAHDQAPAAAPAARQPKVVYVRAAPVVTTVPSAAPAQPVGHEDDEGDDHGDRGGDDEGGDG